MAGTYRIILTKWYLNSTKEAIPKFKTPEVLISMESKSNEYLF
jgi:hypothetical protein